MTTGALEKTVCGRRHVVLLSGSATHDTTNRRQKLQDFYCFFVAHQSEAGPAGRVLRPVFNSQNVVMVQHGICGSLRKPSHLHPPLLRGSAGDQLLQQFCPVVCHIAAFCKASVLLPHTVFSKAPVVIDVPKLCVPATSPN